MCTSKDLFIGGLMMFLQKIAVAAVLIAAVLVCAPSAAAVPGQCWSSPFGGFCDGLPEADGSFMHCEQTGFGSSTYRNCYQACLDSAGRLYPTDYQFDTPC
jgi:hypothetical protein